jgi:hypothetical protein
MRNNCYRIDQAYSVNFDKMIQFRTENTYRRRCVNFYFLTRRPVESSFLKKQYYLSWQSQRSDFGVCLHNVVKFGKRLTYPRHIRRVLFGWFWKNNQENWVPYNYHDSLLIERAKINREAEIVVDIQCTLPFTQSLSFLIFLHCLTIP